MTGPQTALEGFLKDQATSSKADKTKHLDEADGSPNPVQPHCAMHKSTYYSYETKVYSNLTQDCVVMQLCH